MARATTAEHQSFTQDSQSFLGAVRTELSRARDYGRPLAVVALRAREPLGTVGELCCRLAECLRAADRIAIDGAECVLVLLAEASSEDACGWIHRVTAGADLPLLAGIAGHPGASTFAEGLLDAARSALGGARNDHPFVVAGAPSCILPLEAAQLVVCGPTMGRLLRLGHIAAQSRLPILLLGETGTGKEVMARALHQASPQRKGPFHAVNCGALPPSLLESTLFGHEKGAFTGAIHARAGLFEQASGGTLFLDEVGELSLEAQAAVLRVLETKRAMRIGGVHERALDMRVIAATHRHLGAMCERGQFRDDLHFRINAITLTVPPLRERPEEIPGLAEYFLRSVELPRGCPRCLAQDAIEHLLNYRWPGNVRELRNVIERAAVFAAGSAIESSDLPDAVRIAATPTTPRLSQVGEAPTTVASGTALRVRMQRFEADQILRSLRQVGGNKTQAAQLLKMPLRTFMKRVREYGIE